MEIHAVPMMGQSSHLALPELQKGHGPEGHENAEEHGTGVVE